MKKLKASSDRRLGRRILKKNKEVEKWVIISVPVDVEEYPISQVYVRQRIALSTENY